ncbi:MAG: hypothetical protein HZC29_03130, partial [Thaumarchaeota archaeon]|nr:hypothetical protein [Nitrososphaerota archaeon]
MLLFGFFLLISIQHVYGDTQQNIDDLSSTTIGSNQENLPFNLEFVILPFVFFIALLIITKFDVSEHFSLSVTTKKTTSSFLMLILLTSIIFTPFSISMSYYPSAFAQTDDSRNGTANNTQINLESANVEQIANMSLQHLPIEINKPVIWIENITLSEASNSTIIEVPADAKILEIEKENNQNVIQSMVQQDASIPIDEQFSAASLEQMGGLIQEQKPTKFIKINDTSSEYQITYQTSPPIKIEQELSTQNQFVKEVLITHNSALHYTNVTSFVDIPEDLVLQGIEFKPYWITNDTKISILDDPRFNVKFVDS